MLNTRAISRTAAAPLPSSSAPIQRLAIFEFLLFARTRSGSSGGLRSRVIVSTNNYPVVGSDGSADSGNHINTRSAPGGELLGGHSNI